MTNDLLTKLEKEPRTFDLAARTATFGERVIDFARTVPGKAVTTTPHCATLRRICGRKPKNST